MQKNKKSAAPVKGRSTGLKVDQKITLLAIGVVLVFLTSLIIFRKTNFNYENQAEQNVNPRADRDQQEQYRKLLASIKPDKLASAQLFKEIISEEDVRKQMEAELQVNQVINQPDIPDKDISLSRASGKDAVISYFKSLAPVVTEYSKAVSSVTEKSFQSGVSTTELQTGIAKTDVYLANAKQIAVPKELVAFHKAEMLAVYSQKGLLAAAAQYHESGTSSVWPEIYKQFVIAEKQVDVAQKEFEKVDSIYKIKDIALLEPDSRFAKVGDLFATKEAHAQFGGSVVVIGNVPEQIKDGVKQAFASAYGRYATKFLQGLISTIEKNYKIANFLYYSDAVKGQYVNNYLAKYSNAVDQEIIKRFIPELTCGKDQNASLKPLFQAKAQEYLGFDPANVSSSDPDFELKMARVGEYYANPLGWQNYYDDQAQQAASEAEKSVSRELSSSGLKSPRELLDNQIAASLNVIENSQVAALVSSFQLGAVNAENIVSQLVTSVLDSLANKFIFKGAVLQEQTTCTPIPVLNPIIPAEAVVISETGATGNAQLRGSSN